MNLAVHPGYETASIFAVICDNYLIESDGPGACLHKTPKRIFEFDAAMMIDVLSIGSFPDGDEFRAREPLRSHSSPRSPAAGCVERERCATASAPSRPRPIAAPTGR